MGEVPGWIREQLRDAGWVVVESLETFDIHLGDRYPNRATALRKALAGEALLSSSGKTVSNELEGEFFVGRLRQSLKPIESSEEERLLLYSLDSVERHTMPTQEEAPREAPPGARETRAWTCPACSRTWQLPTEEVDVPQVRERCPECGEPPSEFTPGQIVRVIRPHASRARLGVVDEPVQTDYVSPEDDEVRIEGGPYTGEYMVWHLSEAYGSGIPTDPDFEREVFSVLPADPERRRALCSHIMTGIAAAPEQIEALEEELSGT